MTVTANAYAKLNLSLDVVGRRDDGYHLLRTIMQSVSLCDIITVSSCDEEGIHVYTSNAMIADDKSNLAYKAAAAFFDAAQISDRSVSISIEKNIPIQAGLAGGSADAAGVLRALDKLYGTDFSDSKLCEIGEKLGADVPFCLMGGTMLAEGIGEQLTSLPSMPDCFIVIAKPADGVSTAAAYSAVDSLPDNCARPDVDAAINSIKNGDLTALSRLLGNIFEIAVKLPSTQSISSIMLSDGALGSIMTGSGSAVFGIFDRKDTADLCAKKLRDTYSDVYVTTPVSHGVEII